jgi:hypothetical protein
VQYGLVVALTWEMIKFQDRFITMGSNGGEQVADELLAKTREYLRTIMDDSDRLDVVVRAFANLEGLGSTLIRDGRIKDSSQLRNFFTGFSSRLALFDFVDVGAGKERTDNKIRGKNPFVFRCSTLDPPDDLS